MSRVHVMALVLGALVATGCCKESSTEKPAEASGTKGLADPSNDKALVDLTKPVLTCKWASYGFDANCPAYKAWSESDLFKNGAGDATLVNYLDDPDEKVRYLGARMLGQKGNAYRKDGALATRVVDGADKETSKVVVSPLGRAVGSIDLVAVGLAPRVETMIESHSNDDLREALAGGTMSANREAPGMYALFVKLARADKNAKVRKAAAASFWTGTPRGKHEDVCKLWLELAGDKDGDLAGHSAYHCAFSPLEGGCTGQWDALLSLIERQAKSGEVKSSFTASALKYLYDQKKVSAAQKKRALAVAKLLVENTKNDGSARGSALEFVGKQDPGGKAYAARFDNDAAFFVKSAAKRIKEGR